jgi:hypothetical protein
MSQGAPGDHKKLRPGSATAAGASEAMPVSVLRLPPVVLRMLRTVIRPRRHDCGYPRFVLDVTTTSSDQSHRLYVAVQGKVDSHDARGSTWEVVQVRPLKRSRNVSGSVAICHRG